MMFFDIEFDLYSDEPPKYFSRPATEFDGYDPVESNDERGTKNDKSGNF